MKINRHESFTEKYGCGGWLCITIITLLLLFGLSCLEAWVALLLWDWVVVATLGWVAPNVMTFWPMWGLLDLCSILFKTRHFKSNKD